ncbi:MAG: hypothetical protein LC122_14085 [Chitinophagales bacterium]|nr:hypothetical protein [Chitinophagales bacterium]
MKYKETIYVYFWENGPVGHMKTIIPFNPGREVINLTNKAGITNSYLVRSEKANTVHVSKLFRKVDNVPHYCLD